MITVREDIKKRWEMIQRGEVPEGYKKTKVGIIPKDWEVKKLGDLFKFNGGYPIPRKKLGKEGVCYLHYGDIHTTKNTFIDIDEEKKKAPKVNINTNEIKEQYYLDDGDIVFADASEDYEGIGKSVTIINETKLPFIAGLHTIVAKDKTDLIYRDYKGYFLLNHIVRKQFMFYATGLSVLGISMDNIKKIVVSLPPIKEEQKIAQILSTWDEAIDLKEKLIEEKQEQKKGLMQNLLTGKVRLPGFEEEWEEVRLGKLIKESNERSTQINQYDVLSVTKEGIVLQSEYFNKQIASANNKGYKILKKGDLVFSAMNLWMGSVDILIEYEVGIVSPAYKVFKIDYSKIDMSFFKDYVKSSKMIYLYIINSEQGASVVRRNLDLKGLLNSRVSIPPLAEQRAIGKILSTADREIDLLKEEVELLKEQKKGLMQLLLTGIVRVDDFKI